MRMRLTVTKEWDAELEAYENAEWPPGSGEHKDLTTPEEIAAYEQHQLDEGDMTIDEILDLGDENTVYKVEPVPYVQTSEPAAEGENPFLEPTTTADATTTEAPASASTPATGTAKVESDADNNVVGDQGAGFRHIESVTPKFSE